MTDLAQLLVKAKVFAELWNAQDGCGAYVLDELAATINGYLRENPLLAQAAAAKARADARRSGVALDGYLAPVRTATDEADRERVRKALEAVPSFVALGKADLVELPDFHLQRVHVELELHAGEYDDVVAVRNRSTCELEIVLANGTSVALPPSAEGTVPSGSIVRTPPRVLDELTRGVER